MERQDVHATPATLCIQCHPEFAARRRCLGQINEYDPYRIACERIKHLYGCTCCVALVACELKLARDERR